MTAVIRSSVLVLLAGALAGLLAGCSDEVSADDVTDSIREAMANQGVELASVSCPAGVPPQVGATVICPVELTGTDPLGVPVDRIRVVVTQVDGDEVRYRLEPLAVGTPDDAPATETDDTSATTG